MVMSLCCHWSPFWQLSFCTKISFSTIRYDIVGGKSGGSTTKGLRAKSLAETLISGGSSIAAIKFLTLTVLRGLLAFRNTRHSQAGRM